jgi:hypothetical protein
MRGDQQVVGADQRPAPLEVGANLRVMESRVAGEVDRINVG